MPSSLPALRLRPVCQADRAFLFRVFASTRPDIAASNLGENEKREFLQMQFRAQHSHYAANYANADFLVVLLADTPIGRLYLHRGDVFEIVDIALLPSHRGKGIGGRLLADILHEARSAGKTVRIYVEHFNPARSLYERLGFREVADTGTHFQMELRPGGLSLG